MGPLARLLEIDSQDRTKIFALTEPSPGRDVLWRSILLIVIIKFQFPISNSKFDCILFSLNIILKSIFVI